MTNESVNREGLGALAKTVLKAWFEPIAGIWIQAHVAGQPLLMQLQGGDHATA